MPQDTPLRARPLPLSESDGSGPWTAFADRTESEMRRTIRSWQFFDEQDKKRRAAAPPGSSSMWEFPKIRGTLFWGPYDKDPTI